MHWHACRVPAAVAADYLGQGLFCDQCFIFCVFCQCGLTAGLSVVPSVGSVLTMFCAHPPPSRPYGLYPTGAPTRAATAFWHAPITVA
jgi:hypothetical protein